MKAIIIISTLTGIISAALACNVDSGDSRTLFVILAWVSLSIPFGLAVGGSINSICRGE